MRRLTILCDDEWAAYLRDLIGVREHGEVYAIESDARVCPGCGEELAPGVLECEDES